MPNSGRRLGPVIRAIVRHLDEVSTDLAALQGDVDTSNLKDVQSASYWVREAITALTTLHFRVTTDDPTS
jgi:hypothetical protein